jgi:hypothetical protein
MLFPQQSVSDKQMNQQRKTKERLMRMFTHFSDSGKHLDNIR